MEKKISFKKIDENKFAFVLTTTDIERTEVVNKSFVKDHYEDLIRQKQELLNNLGATNKKLEMNKVEKNDELEHFIQLANNAAKYNQYLKTNEDLKVMTDMLENINISVSNIEHVLPEVKRQPKN